MTSALDMPKIMSYIYNKSWKLQFSASSSIIIIEDFYLQTFLHSLRASFPLGHVLRNSAVLFAMSLNFEKSKIEMTSSIDKNIKRFNGDRTKLEEVFLNILTNAKDALADCKYAPRLQFRAKKLDDKILIQCQDNGCGIPTEIVDKLYEPFFTTKENGTGLGLAVSKRIIEAHNGTIDITSDHTNGTIVSITLPA